MTYSQRERQKRIRLKSLVSGTTSIVRCHPTLLVHCMTAHMTTAITHVALEGREKLQKDPRMVFLCFKA